MAKIKQAAIQEIHWNIPSWNEGEDASKRLRQVLKADARHFATVSIGPKDYFWDFPEPGWTPLSQADPISHKAASDELAKLRARVESVAPKYAGHLLTVPNEDYIFFRLSPEGATEILLTGWGYTNYKKATGGSRRVVRNTANLCDARIGFAVNGQIQPGRQFQTLTVGGQANTFTTGADGWYPLHGMKEGETQQVRDVISGKTFPLTWSSEQPDHLLDVTQRASLQVNVSLDSKPIPSEKATVTIGSESHEIDIANGSGEFNFLWAPGTSVSVSVRDQQQTLQAQPLPARNYVDFHFETPEVLPPDVPVVEEPEPPQPPLPPTPPEVPLVKTTIGVIDHNGRPLSGADITLRQGEKTIQGKLGPDGRFSFPADALRPGTDIVTSLATPGRAFQPITWRTEPGETEYVLQELQDKGPSIVGEILAAFGYILAAALFSWGIVELGKYLYYLLY